MPRPTADPSTRADHGWCINCFRPFTREALRYWFGDPRDQVGPFCAHCDTVIKIHTRFRDRS